MALPDRLADGLLDAPGPFLEGQVGVLAAGGGQCQPAHRDTGDAEALEVAEPFVVAGAPLIGAVEAGVGEPGLDVLMNVEVFAFQGILAPAGLPAAITTRLNTDLNKALLNPAVVKRMNDFGMEALPGTPVQFRAMARAESKRWGEIIKAAGVKLD